MPKLRFLCLHGYNSSARMLDFQLSMDLGSVQDELSKDNSAEFTFVDGLEESSKSWEFWDDTPEEEVPFFRYFPMPKNFDFKDIDMNEYKQRLREAIEYIHTIVEEEGPFDGILGYSHGGQLAAYFLLHHAQEHPHDLPSAVFRCAVFISSLPTVDEIGTELQLEGAIRIPTFHVAGKLDLPAASGEQVYRTCEQSLAERWMHEKGHLIPRDERTTKALAKGIRELGNKLVGM